MNSISVAGRLGKDPILKELGNGKKVATVSLAEDQGSKEKPRTLWYTLNFWGNSADIVMQYCKKGMGMNVIAGGLKVDEWEKEGNKYHNVVIDVDKFKLPPRLQATENVTTQNTAPTAETVPAQTAPAEDEIPF